MTDPQELWVGPGSQAAQEKAAYEVRAGAGAGWAERAGAGHERQASAARSEPRHGRLHAQPAASLAHALVLHPLPPPAHVTPPQRSFGPFYRITQLILTTTPAANSSFTAPSGLPAIVTGGQRGQLWRSEPLSPNIRMHGCR